MNTNDSDSDSQLSPTARSILTAARHADDPREADRARVGRALFSRVALGATVATGTGLWATSAAALPAVKAVILPVLFAIVGGVVGGTAVWRAAKSDRGATGAPAALVAAAPAPTSVPALASATAAPPPAPVTPAVAAPAAAPDFTAATRDRSDRVTRTQLDRETALLGAVSVALRTGQPRRGLALLDRYERRFPVRILREELSGARILARCQLAVPTVPTGIQAQAAAFLRQYPASPLAARMRNVCEGSTR